VGSDHKTGIQEFFVVMGAAYLASVIYHAAIISEWPSSPLYIVANLFLATAVEFELIALGFGRCKNSQSQYI